MERSDPIVYFNGHLVPASKATINALSPALTRGPLPYETLRGYWSEIESELFLFRVDDHLRRLGASMRILRFRELFDPAVLTRAFREVAAANGFREDIHYRLFAFPQEQERKRYATTRAGIVIDAAPRPAKTPRPAVCAVSPWRRGGDDVQPARVKAMGIRMFARAAMDQAIEGGYDQLILLNERGKLSESVSSNLFLVRRGVLVTPEATASLLEGITRATVLELAAARGLATVEREVDLTELYDADEAFLCSTGLEILPIRSVDGIVLGDGEPGETTRVLGDLYGAVIRGRDPARRHWLTPVYGGAA